MNKIEEKIKHEIGEDQARFTVRKSSIDHVHTIQQLLKKKKAKNKDVHLVFIDLKKSYDLISRKKTIVSDGSNSDSRKTHKRRKTTLQR